MMKKLHVIYVPGLGDTNVSNQRLAVKVWRWYGVEAELCHMQWARAEGWQVKLARLLARIDAAAADGKQVGLVGASAGAAAVLSAYTLRQEAVSGVVCLAGKINRPQTVGQSYRSKNPDYTLAAQAAPGAVEALSPAARQRILSRYALADEVVPSVDSRIAGAQNRRSPTVGHIFTIAFQLTFGAPSFIHFLKKTARQTAA